MIERIERTRHRIVAWMDRGGLPRFIIGTMVLLAPRLYLAILLATAAIYGISILAEPGVFQFIGILAIYWFAMAKLAPERVVPSRE